MSKTINFVPVQLSLPFSVAAKVVNSVDLSLPSFLYSFVLFFCFCFFYIIDFFYHSEYSWYTARWTLSSNQSINHSRYTAWWTLSSNQSINHSRYTARWTLSSNQSINHSIWAALWALSNNQSINPSKAPEFTSGFSGIRVAMFCRSLFARLSFFFWPLYCLSYASLVSSNLSYNSLMVKV